MSITKVLRLYYVGQDGLTSTSVYAGLGQFTFVDRDVELKASGLSSRFQGEGYQVRDKTGTRQG